MTLTLIKPANPGKFIHDYFTRGLEYALSVNRKEYVKSDNITCGGDGEIDLTPADSRYVPPEYDESDFARALYLNVARKPGKK